MRVSYDSVCQSVVQRWYAEETFLLTDLLCAAESFMETPCVGCAAGRYSDEVGANACAGECPTGSFAPPGSVSGGDCVPCDAGKYDHDADSSTPCVDCLPGTYGSLTGALECPGICDAGTFAPAGSVGDTLCFDELTVKIHVAIWGDASALRVHLRGPVNTK